MSVVRQPHNARVTQSHPTRASQSHRIMHRWCKAHAVFLLLLGDFCSSLAALRGFCFCFGPFCCFRFGGMVHLCMCGYTQVVGYCRRVRLAGSVKPV
jgi:hypothetical protein